jgi:asparagine synthase (glutamine-hydrolysing)
MKYRNGMSKWIFRQLRYMYIPHAFVKRSKMDYFAPIGDWLRGLLKSWAKAILDKEPLLSVGFIRFYMIHSKWVKHLASIRIVIINYETYSCSKLR